LGSQNFLHRFAWRFRWALSSRLARPARCFAQDTSSQPDHDASIIRQKATSLQTVVVTGSNIRRVDLETASPVVTIDRAAIQASGKVTLGDLVQQLPAMTGGNVNPQCQQWRRCWRLQRQPARPGFIAH
jgi:hypothetical protein